MRKILFLCIFLPMMLFAQQKSDWFPLIGSAYTDNTGYEVLERICDEAGGRLMGSPEYQKAVTILQKELAAIGIDSKIETFEAPGWFRGDDVVELTSPVKRTLRAAALGYSDRTEKFEAKVIYASYGRREDYTEDPNGKIVLLTQSKPKDGIALHRSEAIDTAAALGAKAVLFINRDKGGELLCGTGDFQGIPLDIPGFTLTYEEGMWIKRLLDRDVDVSMTIAVGSYCSEVTGKNIVASLPGKTEKKVVIGAHFDSWDLGNGGVDNGYGSAILFDVVRIMHQSAKQNEYTIDFVWFDGEELGLWGAQKYVEMHGDEDIVAMINMDMTGRPTGINVMGFEQSVPFSENLISHLKGLNLERGVANIPWTGSDHLPFILQGIPSFTLMAYLDDDMVNWYHDFADTFDKADKEFLTMATTVITVLLYEISNDTSGVFGKMDSEATKQMLIKHGLDKQLKRAGNWNFD